jgi:hypothetical protein
MNRRLKRPSPAFVVAMVALFLALGGTAGAVVSQAVPLAKRALVADNAKKLGGKTGAQIGAAAAAAALSQSPAGARPASTVTGLVVTKTQSVGVALPSAVRTAQISCDSGQTAVAGGMSSDGAVATFDSYPVNPTTWEVGFGSLSSGTANVSLYIICMK